jgi:hypothetical protein
VRVRVGLAVGLLFLGGACAADDKQAGPTPKPAAELSAEKVSLGANLVEIRGHHKVALELSEKGDTKGATVHAGHPVAEILASVKSELSDETGQELEDALNDAAKAAGTGTEELKDALRPTGEAIEKALGETAGSVKDTLSYNASVVATVLQVAAHEYDEAFDDGKIVETVEYQDAYGFVSVASEDYRGIAEQVKKKDAHGAEEIDEALESMQEAVPSNAPPASPAVDADTFTKAAVKVAAELEEYVGAVVDTDADPSALFANAAHLLDEVLEHYEEGEREEAAEYAAEAYLDNYELLEGDVKRAAPEINEALEPILGVQLRQKIKDNAPLKEVEALVTRAKKLLERAEEAVEAHEH